MKRSSHRLATSATRSVPDAWSFEVSTASPPNRETAPAISSLSVATTTRDASRHSRAASHTCCTSGLPLSARSALRGRRTESSRAGMTTSARSVPLDDTGVLGGGIVDREDRLLDSHERLHRLLPAGGFPRVEQVQDR